MLVIFKRYKSEEINMKKILCYVLIVILGGCMNSSKSESELLDDIKSLPKPINFEEVSINAILEKYISKGMTAHAVSNFFNAEGFSLFVKNNDGPENHDKAHWILYFGESTQFTPPAYKIVVEINYIDQKVSEFAGFYLKNMY